MLSDCRGSWCCGSSDRCYIPSSGNSDRMSGKMWSGGGTLGCKSKSPRDSGSLRMKVGGRVNVNVGTINPSKVYNGI